VNALATVGRVLVAAFLVAGAAGGLSASAGTSRAGGPWIVFGSDRDGAWRGYSMRPDGSRLTPLLPRGRALSPVAASADGSTLAYSGARGLYVSRGDGSRLRLVVRVPIEEAVLSRDGRLLAFRKSGSPGIWIVGTDGRGLRRLTSEAGFGSSWSPDGQALVFTTRGTIVVQGLHANRRVLVHGGWYSRPTFSPDGGWIAYVDDDGEHRARSGLYLIRSTGRERHRVVRGSIEAFAWSPGSSRLAAAIGDPADVAVVGAGGRQLNTLHVGLAISTLRWSPDGARLVLAGHAGLDPDQIWVVRPNGRALRRLTSAGTNIPLGWARLAPRLPPAPPIPPTERMLGTNTVATRAPITALSADGARVAFMPATTVIDCTHVAVWTSDTHSLQRLRLPASCRRESSGGDEYGVELAGSSVTWVSAEGGMSWNHTLMFATLADPRPLVLNNEGGTEPDEHFDYHVHGDRDLLVFNDRSRLVRIGLGREPCGRAVLAQPASLCKTLRPDAHACCVESVSAGLIAIGEPDAVAVVDAQGKLVRMFPFPPNDITAARLDEGRLVVARSAALEVYDVATGAGELQRPLPSGYRLADVEGGIAVLRRGDAIMLLRLKDGRSFTVAPGKAPRFADLEPPGLYYSYATADGGGRVVFVPRTDLVRRLDVGA
jgi:Lipoprotein LpqB beta-propeller domain